MQKSIEVTLFKPLASWVRMRAESNGCGVGTGLLNKLVPEGITRWNVSWCDACAAHDYMEEHRTHSMFVIDLVFLANLLTLSSTIPSWWKRWICYGFNMVYFLAVVLGHPIFRAVRYVRRS